MCFHARITITGVDSEPSRSIIALGDTVIVEQDGKIVNLTEGVQKSYSEISYSLEDDDQEEQKPAPKKQSQDDDDESSEEEEGSEEVLQNGGNVMTSSRLRSKAIDQKERQNDLLERKTHQLALHDAKVKELKIRFQRGEIASSAKKEKVRQMDTIESYKNMK